MKSFSTVLPTVSNQRGGVVIFVAVAMVVLIACSALAIGLTHLYVARNELQNACDAGALAGARFLYVKDGTLDAASAINASGYVSETLETIPSANQMGYAGATANMSEKVSVEVLDPYSNNGDVQRGHWSFGYGNLARGFYPNDSTAMVISSLIDPVAYDENTNYINAVRVRARREATPIASWFARIFGRDSFQLSADAVAWVGWAKGLEPNASDQPIAICKQAIINDYSVYDCNVGRMLNSGQDSETHNTAGWTNFSQPCSTANANEMRSLICNPDGANVNALDYDNPMGAVGGVQSSVLRDLIKCWISQTDTDGDCIPDKVWNMTLPVVDCPGNNVSNCAELEGVVNVNFVWVLGNVGAWVNKNTDPYTPNADAPEAVCGNDVTVIDPDTGLPTITTEWEECTTSNKEVDCSNVIPIVPNYMSYEDANEVLQEWSASSPDATIRWANFVSNYNLQDVLGNPPHYNQKTMYFFPDCKYHEPTGNSGGVASGIPAEIPVLVE